VADYAYGDEAEEERISLRCGEWINDAHAKMSRRVQRNLDGMFSYGNS
jgi:hypothetical protein